MSNCDIVYSPLKFLGATVLSFNSSLGLGSSESTLNVDLVEDCEASPPDAFLPKNGSIGVGAPVYFTAGSFSFGGVLATWTVNQGRSGKTFNVKVTDPRQLLENTVVVTDSYLGPPTQGLNYFNAYAYWESQVLQGNCAVFGDSMGTERGMPYQMIIQALIGMVPTIYSPTGYSYTINFNSFPQGLPEYYRVAGPSITLLQLLQDVCDVTGFDFYVNLLNGGIISVGLVDLKLPPPSFSTIITAYDGKATELSYGQELRNEVTKTVLFGEKQHYLTRVTQFSHFFGEDLINGQYTPVVPFAMDDCGFWVRKDIQSLNATLETPFPTNGPYVLHELDIRSAMSSMELWLLRALDPHFAANGTLNKALQELWPKAVDLTNDALTTLLNAANRPQPVDSTLNPIRASKFISNDIILTELEITYNWIKNLGNTYYGKQFITPLNQKICYHFIPNAPLGEKMFSDIPTNEGAWLDDGQPVLGLSDPDLSLFREEDGRIGGFGLFNNEGTYDTSEPDVNGESGDFDGSVGDIDIQPPTIGQV